MNERAAPPAGGSLPAGSSFPNINVHKNSDVFSGVQALRFFAAVLVVISHAVEMANERGLSSIRQTWDIGHAGVDIFFVISGFVMYFSIDNLRKNSDGWKVFIVRRIKRIVPMYWIALTLKVLTVLAFAKYSLHSSITIEKLFTSYFFLPTLNEDGLVRPFLPVGWTLNLEMLFYVICAVSLLLSNKPFILVTIAIFFLAACSFSTLNISPEVASLFQPLVLEFIFGLSVACITKYKGVQNRWFSLCLVTVGVGTIIWVKHDPGQYRFLIWGVPATLMVLGIASLEKNIKDKIPMWILICGDASYSVYLFHTFVVPALGVVFLKFGLSNLSLVVVTSIFLSTFSGVVIYFAIEKNITRALKGMKVG